MGAYKKLQCHLANRFDLKYYINTIQKYKYYPKNIYYVYIM